MTGTEMAAYMSVANGRSTGLDPRLDAIIEQVEVGADGASVTVGGRHLTAETTMELRQKTAHALYEIFHAGHRIPGPGNTGSEGARDSFRQLLRDPELIARLESRVPHTVSPVAISPVAGSRTGDPHADPRITEVDGLRVCLDPADEVADGQAWLPAVRRALSPGFLLVDGARGRPEPGPLLRTYLHVDGPDDGVHLWGETLRRLESAGVRYRAKVTSSGRLCPRRDGLVVYLGEDAWDAAPGLFQGIQPKEKAHRSDLSSAFARVISPGVAQAWEPEDDRPGKRGASFGQHRAGAVADALVAVADGGRTLHECLVRELREANIDPAALHRNLGSPELLG